MCVCVCCRASHVQKIPAVFRSVTNTPCYHGAGWQLGVDWPTCSPEPFPSLFCVFSYAKCYQHISLQVYTCRRTEETEVRSFLFNDKVFSVTSWSCKPLTPVQCQDVNINSKSVSSNIQVQLWLPGYTWQNYNKQTHWDVTEHTESFTDVTETTNKIPSVTACSPIQPGQLLCQTQIQKRLFLDH